MLRYTLGETVFFGFMKSYSEDSLGGFRHNSATTDDVTAKLSNYVGEDMSWFIDQWVKQPNHPVYQNTYSITSAGGGNWTLRFTTNQTQTNSPFHKMPLTVKVSFTSGSDSLIRVMNDVNNQSFDFSFTRQPTALVFDPGNDIVLKTATTTLGTSSSIAGDESRTGSDQMNFTAHGSDVNRDGSVDADDVRIVEADVVNFVSGYLKTDVNRDGTVDATDLAITENIASINFIVSKP
jgi:aminopeptidase N